MNIFDFTVQAQDGNAVPMSGYKGKVLLIVNTATGSLFRSFPKLTCWAKMPARCFNIFLPILPLPVLAEARWHLC